MYLLHTILFLSFNIYNVRCACTQSFTTFCDNLEDLSKSEDAESWTDLVIGNVNADASDLQDVDFDTFSLDRLEKLETLIVVRQIKDIKSYTFTPDHDFSRLDYLKLFGNEIKRIKFTTFDGLRLRKLSLKNNSIEYFHKGAFYNCEIFSIDLSHNNMESIEREVFSEEFLGNATKEMIFKNNRLEVVQTGALPSSLEILNLSHNKISVLHYDVFANLENLQELRIGHNRLSSLPGLKTFQDIVVIDASFNKILSIRAAEFLNLTSLEVVDLGHNRISYPLVFQKFHFPQRHPSLQISLAFNRLTHLKIEDSSFKHHIVFIYGNPWDCRCLAGLEKFMADNNVKRNACELRFFGNGEVPYCINYSPGADCQEVKVQHPNYTNEDIENFLQTIRRREDSVGCRLSPRRL